MQLAYFHRALRHRDEHRTDFLSGPFSSFKILHLLTVALGRVPGASAVLTAASAIHAGTDQPFRLHGMPPAAHNLQFILLKRAMSLERNLSCTPYPVKCRAVVLH